MPNTANAKKALKQNKKRRLRNRSQRSSLRSVVKKCRQAADAGDTTAAEAAFGVAVQKLDKAAAKRLIHPNAAARTKSRLSKLVKATKGGSAGAGESA